MNRIIDTVKIEITPEDQDIPVEWDMDSRLILTFEEGGKEEIIYFSSNEVSFTEKELVSRKLSDVFYLLGYKECKYSAIKHLESKIKEFKNGFAF